MYEHISFGSFLMRRDSAVALWDKQMRACAYKQIKTIQTQTFHVASILLQSLPRFCPSCSAAAPHIELSPRKSRYPAHDVRPLHLTDRPN